MVFKYLISLNLFLAFVCQAQATVDGNDRVYIVVQEAQTEEFFVERVPVIGCYGLPQGPQLQQFTAEYLAPYNVGCGGPAGTENINALTCAKVVSAIESADYSSFKDIVLDISKCPAKDNKQFITMVRTAAKRNFPQKKGEVKLTLIK